MKLEYTPTTPDAFNAIRESLRSDIFSAEKGLRQRGPDFAFGGCTVDIWFDDRACIAYVDFVGNGASWLCAFNSITAEKMLNLCLRNAQDAADERGIEYGDAQRWQAYAEAARKLLHTLPAAQVPKSVCQQVAWERENGF